MVELSPLRQLRLGQLPKMVSWYDPRLLARIGVRTIVSSVFGQYADQRLMQAVTDPAEDKDLVARYDYRDPNAAEPHRCVACDETGAFWIDYVADVGDGFEATYTMAYLMAQDSLDIRGAGPCATARSSSWVATSAIRRPRARNTRSGCCSPSTGPIRYRIPTASSSRSPAITTGTTASTPSTACSAPRATSSPTPAATSSAAGSASSIAATGRCACPTTGGSGAPTSSSRSISTAPRSTTSSRVAEQMGPQDNLIICLAEPSWMLADLQGQDDEENFFKITSIARARGARVVAVIAGDWHNYSRYYAHELDVHFITSGGGGAFLHPTHVLQKLHLGALAGVRRRVVGRLAPAIPAARAPARPSRPRTTTSVSSATRRWPRASSSRRCKTCRTPSSRSGARGSACAGARRSSRRLPSAIPARAAATS